jgi:hypothetical protein
MRATFLATVAFAMTAAAAHAAPLDAWALDKVAFADEFVQQSGYDPRPAAAHEVEVTQAEAQVIVAAPLDEGSELARSLADASSQAAAQGAEQGLAGYGALAGAARDAYFQADAAACSDCQVALAFGLVPPTEAAALDAKARAEAPAFETALRAFDAVEAAKQGGTPDASWACPLWFAAGVGIAHAVPGTTGLAGSEALDGAMLAYASLLEGSPSPC